ncbi:MAG: hypothetical protein ACRDR6_27860, partial [Pseudonocardiaceae bacterium]
MIATYDEVLNQARGLGEQRHPAAGLEQHAAYANSVAYGVTGMSGGFGGPSMREHQCSRVISNQGGAGTLTFDSAAELLDSLCYGPMTTDIARMRTEECCFDDSEADLKAAAALLVLDPGQLWLHDHAARNQSMRDTLRAWATNPPGSTVWAESEMAMMGVLTQLQPGPPHRLRGADLVAVATA